MHHIGRKQDKGLSNGDMKQRQLTPLEQILENTLLNAEKRMWDSLTEVMILEEDIAGLIEFLPRIKAIGEKLAGLQVEMAMIRIDMDNRERKPKTKQQNGN